MKFADEWEDFKKSVVPDDAPDIQITEMRTAFYAGALAFSTAILNALEHTRPKEGSRFLANLRTEVKLFLAEDVKSRAFLGKEGNRRMN